MIRKLVFLSISFIQLSHCSPEVGKWDFLHLTQETNYVGMVKNAFSGSLLDIQVKCNTAGLLNVTIGYMLRRTLCWEEYLSLDTEQAPIERIYKSYYRNPGSNIYENVRDALPADYRVEYVSAEFTTLCNDVINMHPHAQIKKAEEETINQSVYILPSDGVYLLVVYVGATSNAQPSFTANVHVELKSVEPLSYLSITDLPLLWFYRVMCGVYVLLGLGWLVLCSLHRQEILRIQVWIGGVLMLGMLEKAMFTAEYQNINNSGNATEGLILVAEVVSCAKRTLARILVIILSLGFGIVKPQLAPIPRRVPGIGGLYFALASIESVLRVIHPKNDPSNKTLLAAVPLAVIDALIYGWVFSSLFRTTRTLRSKKNHVQLSLFNHFTKTMIFAVVSSIIFMVWSIKHHKVVDCLTEWRSLWVDEAFWHLLFSVVLCVIMILWRPSQNNQRSLALESSIAKLLAEFTVTESEEEIKETEKIGCKWELAGVHNFRMT